MMKNLIIITITLFVVACTPAGGTRPTSTVGGGSSSTATHSARDSKAAEINVQLGLNYLQRGNYEIALEKLEKALQQDPNLPSAHNTVALLYQRLSVLDKTEYHFKKAVSLQPTYSEAQNNYGVFLCQQKRYEEAEKRFLATLKNPLYRSSAQALENAGMCANRIPDQTLAESYFRKALQKNENLSKSLLQMAKLRFLDVDYEEAHSYMKRYQTVGKWSASALFTAIQIENKRNNQNAVASYALLLKANFPDSDEARQVKRGQY